MYIDFISKKNARRQTLETIKGFLAKNKDRIDELMAREAKGMAKLEKAERKSLQKDALPDTTGMALAAPPMSPLGPVGPVGPVGGPGPVGISGAPPLSPVAPPANLCFGCGGSETEPLGNHMGLDHFMCRDCGEVGVTIKEENEQASQGQAQDALAAMATQSLSPMIKKDPNDTSEDQRETKPKEEPEKAYKAAWLSQKKDKEDVKKAIDSQDAAESRQEMASCHNRGKEAAKKYGEHDVDAVNGSNVSRFNDRHLQGERHPDSFAPGASQKYGAGAYKSEMTKGAMPMGKSVEAVRQAAGMMGGTTPKMPSVKAPTVPITSAAAPQKDAFNTGGMNSTTQAAMGKAEKDPSKKPFNTGAGHGGVPLKEIPDQDVALPEARSGTTPPPDEGGKEVSAPGSGGQIKKTNMKKGEMAPTPLSKVSDIRGRAAAKHAAKRQQVASDVNDIRAVSSAVQPNVVQKAEGIPAAPKAPGAGAVKAPPVKAPATASVQASSPTPPKL